MSNAPPSPKRRHILSSINPDRPENFSDKYDKAARRERSPTPQYAEATEHKPQDDVEEPLRPRPTRLKLKKSSRRHRSRSWSRTRLSPRDEDARDPPRHESDRRHHSRRHRSRKYRHRHSRRSPNSPRASSASRATPDIPGPPPLDPEAAFRESLFDAMADDEGAMYWESVYGQPIHVYSNEKVGPQGKLERMTDEEYAAYVRQKMYEKTHAGLLEEKARREEQSKRKREEEKQRRRQQDEQARHSRKLQDEMEQSLRRGEARKQRKEWDTRWTQYTDAWASWNGDVAKLPWPSKDGARLGVDEKGVRAFFVQCLNLKDIGERAFVAKLKEERVRWHPDKIQQRLGGTVDASVMKDVTAVFQIIDRLWGEMRR
ncbi:hypothetical protein HIM_04537 [Hirsutella minnesotensis 3608]|uniref:Uncharacterized protein n=1 Tax=Hirsutella minnesotensis 3608 TaxID=1043627 RepID=A0A0F7ZL75_9HYPO|nr:hypothetical protein HIM_04537 [Hirsutella minnesotensis 3608]